MAWFYHNWTSDGSEVAVEIPDFQQDVPHCGDNTSILHINDALEDFGSWQIEIENASTLSPASIPLDQLHDQWDYLNDACVLAQNYVSFIEAGESALYQCMVDCSDYNNLFRWCSNSSTFGNNSMNDLYHRYAGWAGEIDNAVFWLENLLYLQDQTEQAIEFEQGYIATNTQIDMMKANLQIHLANAQAVVNRVEAEERMSNLRLIFLPVMAILLVVIIVWFLIGEK
jgi:hypothetical protein